MINPRIPKCEKNYRKTKLNKRGLEKEKNTYFKIDYRFDSYLALLVLRLKYHITVYDEHKRWINSFHGDQEYCGGDIETFNRKRFYDECYFRVFTTRNCDSVLKIDAVLDILDHLKMNKKAVFYRS